MNVLQVVGLTPPHPLAAQRLEACLSCPFVKTVLNETLLETKWCGEPLFGGMGEHEGELIELCGCNVNLKSKDSAEECPANRWPKQ